MIQRIMVFLFLLGAVATAHSQQQAGWIADPKTGCRMWDPSPESDERITWDGPCVDGYGHGRGVLRWYVKDKLGETDEGEFRKGKLNGYVILKWSSGGTLEGEFRDQKPNGKATLTTSDGQVFSGIWRDGCFDDGNRKRTFNTTREACGFR